MRKKLRFPTSKIKTSNDSAPVGSIFNQVRPGQKTSVVDTIAAWNVRRAVQYMVFTAVVLGLATSWVWYNRLYLNPERRFWSAIDTSMATKSVVRTIVNGGSGNGVTQENRIHFSPQQVIENRVTYIEKGATTDTNVVTEGIVYPSEQFLRYTNFNSRSEDTVVTIDDLLGKWANQQGEQDEVSKDNARQTYLSEYVTLAIFGNYPAAFRDDTIAKMKAQGVYTIDYRNVSKSKDENGSTVFSYPVVVKLPEYTTLLQESFLAAGYGSFSALDRENYRDGSTVSALLKVSAKSGVITAINFNGRDESYSNYGVAKQIEAPTPELTIDELQAKLQEKFGAPASE